MACSMIAGSCISARKASAAMALITAATEPEHEIIAFSAPTRGGYVGMHGGVSCRSGGGCTAMRTPKRGGVQPSHRPKAVFTEGF